MAQVNVAKIPKRRIRPSNVLATLCYYYPQYTLQEARKLPYKHVKMLLDEMTRIEATKYFNLLQISVAPHTQDGKGVKALNDYYKEQMNE